MAAGCGRRVVPPRRVPAAPATGDVIEGLGEAAGVEGVEVYAARRRPANGVAW